MRKFFDVDTESLPSGFPLDVIENDTEYTVKASVAGFDPNKIDISYDDNILSIKGEVADENVDEQAGKYHIRERYYGNFQRSISMPGVVDADRISAETENGILVVHLPKKPETQPKKISVNAK